MTHNFQPESGFAPLGLTQDILSSLSRSQIIVPTPIQEQAIPLALQGRDLIGIAQTGTGKTFAFALPIIQQLSGVPGDALIVVPTRELALQVEENVRLVTRFMREPMRSVTLIGGASMYKQVQDIRKRPQIIIATPGRLIDHLQQGNIRLGGVRILVLDEADRMLDMGFAPQITRILESVPSDRQTMLFSATMAPEIRSIASNYLKDPAKVEIASAGTANKDITQELVVVPQVDKIHVLERLLEEHEGSVLVFCRTKHGVTKLARHLYSKHFKVSEIHSNRTLSQRRMALDGFKSGRYRILIATDIAARGIDVNGIQLVVNFDLPDASEDYVHRIGRTGRAGMSGLAVSLACPDQVREVRQIERLMKITLAYSKHSPSKLPEAGPRQAGPNRRFDRSRRPQQGGYRPDRPMRNDRPGRGDRNDRPQHGQGGRSRGRRAPELGQPKFHSHGRKIQNDGAFQSFR